MHQKIENPLIEVFATLRNSKRLVTIKKGLGADFGAKGAFVCGSRCFESSKHFCVETSGILFS